MRLIAYGKTDVGVARTKNEDYFCSEEDIGLFVVADGMGGHASGEVASRMAVEIILDHMSPSLPGEKRMDSETAASFSKATRMLASGIRRANKSIYETSQKDGGLKGMGTTVAAALIEGSNLSIAHVGDSRIYLVRDNALFRLTDDHSLVSEQVKKGLITREEAELSDFSNVITRALGYEATVTVDLDELHVREGDRVLLCTDGLTRMVTDDFILSTVSSVDKPEEACKILIDTACAHGGKDNITVVAIFFFNDGWVSRLKKLFR
jgi:serine/threonine protein phosphatase PrpC